MSVQQQEEAKTKTPQQVPLYHRIKDEVRRRIAEGVWKPGQAIPNRNVLSAEFGTTRVTLDKAIQQLVDEGVLRSARGSGTFVAPPQSAARRARGAGRDTLRIGIVLEPESPRVVGNHPEADRDSYFGPVLHGVGNGLSGKPVELTYAHLPNTEWLPYFRDTDLDGLILITPSLSNLPMLHQLVHASVPYVAIGISSPAPEDAILPCIDSANRAAGASVVEYLVGLGHQRIACINMATCQANQADRLEGFRDGLIRAGIALDPDLLVLNPIYDRTVFERCIEKWYERVRDTGKLPTAIFSCDVHMTIAALSVLRQNGVAVPEQMSLITFDDLLVMEHLTPPLTAVRQPVSGLGLRAAQRLVQALLGPEGPRPPMGTEFLPTHLVVRASAGPPPAAR